MAKGRTHMYDMMIKEKKKDTIYNSGFFLDATMPDEEATKIITSYKVASSLSRDMQELAEYMTKTIVEGLLNDRR